MPAFQKLVFTDQILSPSDYILTERIASELSQTGKLNIYIRRTKGLGDVLMATLAANALRKKLPHRIFKVHIITSSPFQGLISKLKLVDSVVVDKNVAGSFIVNLQDRIDYLPVCSTGHRLDLMAEAVGLYIHEVQTEFRIKVNTKWRSWGKKRLHPFSFKQKIALAPWATAEIRSWPWWPELLTLLLARDYVVILLHNKFVHVAPHPNLINLTGKTSVLQLFSILSECDAAIAVDSGTLHACGFLGIPFVGLFGSIDPQFRVKYYGKKEIIFLKNSCPICPCWDWQVGACVKTDHYLCCMKNITPKMVLNSLEKLLNPTMEVRKYEMPMERGSIWSWSRGKSRQIQGLGSGFESGFSSDSAASLSAVD